MSSDARTLHDTDLRPFRQAIEAGVASVMSAHVAFPALDQGGGPATLSRRILRGLLRDELGFDGLVVTDALIMAGVLQGETPGGASVRALAAGCDLLLYPSDVEAVAREVAAAATDGRLDPEELHQSAARRGRWAEWAMQGPDAPPTVNARWANEVACRVVHLLRGEPPQLNGPVRITVVDDDVGGPYPPPSRDPFAGRLRELGVRVSDGPATGDAVHLIALFGDIRAWKGRPGYSARALGEVRAAAGSAGSSTVIVQFSHPRLAPTIGVDAPVVCAWGGEAVMQRAAAEWLVTRCGSD